MNNEKLIFIISFLLIIYSLNAQFSLDTENLNYFECEDLLSNEDSIQNKLEKQNIHKILNSNTNSDDKNESQSLNNYIFNNTRQNENTNTRPSAIKNQNFLKYKNFTLEKNFQIMLKIKKNPEFINNENTEKLNLEKIQKNGLYVWLMRNNKFSFEGIRKNIEFNGLAFKIGEADIKFITSNIEKNTIIKPFFDANNDYKSLTNQKTVNSNLREETIKITSVKNLLFVERFNYAKRAWEMAFFENLSFYTFENFGINFEIISDIKDDSESYAIDYLKVCTIKSINYGASDSRIFNKESDFEPKNKMKQDLIINRKLDLNKFKEEIERFKIFDDFSVDKDKKENFIYDFFSLHETIDFLLNELKNNNDKINNNSKLLSQELTIKIIDEIISSKKTFEEMHDLIKEFLNKLNSTVSDSNKNTLNNKDALNEKIKASNLNDNQLSLKSLMDSVNEITKELEIRKQIKNDDKVMENFNLMKNNFNRIDKNLKIIIADFDKEIKSVLSDLLSNYQNDFFVDLIDYLFFFVLATMFVLLYFIYRYVNFLIEVPKDYVKLSRDINNIEKNNIS